jgi:hypothetical protein
VEGDDSSIARVAQLRGATWQWRDDAPEQAKQQPGMGVIAQDVERVFPELVTTDAQGHKRVNYVGLIGPLIEALKELDQRLQRVEGQLQQQPGTPSLDPASRSGRRR